jgi:hypothetical protein
VCIVGGVTPSRRSVSGASSEFASVGRYDDAIESLYPNYAGARRPTITLHRRRTIKKLAFAP